MANARELSLNALLQQEKGAFLNSIFQDILEEEKGLSQEDRNFFIRLSQGVVEERLFLDYVIDRVSSVPTKKMKPVIRNLLRMGTYQIIFMDKIPDSAAINECVKLAERKKFGKLKGFVNGNLRNISRQTQGFKAQDLTGETLQKAFLSDLAPESEAFLSTLYSVPAWMISFWTARYGLANASKIAAALHSEAKIHIWLNTAKASAEEIRKRMEAEGLQLTPDDALQKLGAKAYYLENFTGAKNSKTFTDGLFYIQDAASLEGAAVAANCVREIKMKYASREQKEPGIPVKVLDVCAAPGGKTLFTAISHPDVTVCCRDLSEKKINLIIENIRRLGPENVYPEVFDATKKNPQDEGVYDLVIADLPCTGLGVMGRKSDIKYRLQPSDLEELKDLQQQILRTIAPYVKKGGYLLYSTCTLNPGENEENAAFIEKELGFAATDIRKQLLPQNEPYRDGFYYALFQQK